jgi:hypothetical protein
MDLHVSGYGDEVGRTAPVRRWLHAVPGGRSAGSLAWAGLGNTYFWIDPARGRHLMQLLPFADPKALALLDAFERAVYGGLT